MQVVTFFVFDVETLYLGYQTALTDSSYWYYSGTDVAYADVGLACFWSGTEIHPIYISLTIDILKS